MPLFKGSSSRPVGLIVSSQQDSVDEISLLDNTEGGSRAGESHLSNGHDELSTLLKSERESEVGEGEEEDDPEQDVESTGEDDHHSEEDEHPTTNGLHKKTVKNRHVKAAIMIAVVWTLMLGFLIVSLTVDWSNGLWQNPELCTLCGDDTGIEFEELELTEWPTRKPSSSKGMSSLFTLIEKHKILLPPPENIAEVCSPSIFLNYGPEYVGPSFNDLVAICSNTCFPATCCVANDEEAKLGLIATLESQGLGSQAANFLSSIENCYQGDNIPTCEEYGRWCKTLYKLDAVLDDTISKEMDDFCMPDSINADTAGLSLESHRSFPSHCARCDPLSCCYETAQNPTDVSVLRKRKRTRLPNALPNKSNNSRNLSSNGMCQSFSAEEGSLNARICDAYRPYCNPPQSTISIPSLTRPATSNSLSSSNSPVSNSPTASIVSSWLTGDGSFTFQIPDEMSLSMPIISSSGMTMPSNGPSVQIRTESMPPPFSNIMPHDSSTLNPVTNDKSGQQLGHVSLVPSSAVILPSQIPTSKGTTGSTSITRSSGYVSPTPSSSAVLIPAEPET